MPRDALGPLVTELRDYLTANGGDLAGAIVRGGELAFTVHPTTHLRTVTDKPPAVVLSHVASIREHRTGLVRQRVQATSYGATPQQASQLAGLVSDAFHDRKPRVRSGTLIYETWEEVGAQPSPDPVTDWPREIGLYGSIVNGAAYS